MQLWSHESLKIKRQDRILNIVVSDSLNLKYQSNSLRFHFRGKARIGYTPTILREKSYFPPNSVFCMDRKATILQESLTIQLFFISVVL